MSRQDAAMSKVPVTNTISLYTFTNHESKHSDTITVIVQNNQALFIDTAYPEYAQRVKKEIEQQGIKPEIIVLSHYHPDHVSGCSAFPECQIYASEFYLYNYDNCQVWEPDFTYLHPKQLIRDNDLLSFGDFELTFHHSPGHSKCGIITQITEEIIHVGDLIMITWDRKNSLPYITDGGSFESHIKSLELIKKLDPDAIVVPHGGLIDNKKRINALVEDRLYYLEKVLDSKGTLPMAECLKNDISWYDHLNFHDMNVIQLV
jgi:glyoxylase-like metal-dependent hydrolase (beta-lactamase superfamily II)